MTRIALIAYGDEAVTTAAYPALVALIQGHLSNIINANDRNPNF